MQTGQVERHIQIDRHGVVAAQGSETHLAAFVTHVYRADLRTFAETVGRDGLADARQDVAHVLIIHTQHGTAIERQALDEIDESLFQFVEVVTVGLHVVGIDVGDDCQDGREIKEGRIRLVRFRHDELTCT